jgi:hypothetical protein
MVEEDDHVKDAKINSDYKTWSENSLIRQNYKDDDDENITNNFTCN